MVNRRKKPMSKTALKWVNGIQIFTGTAVVAVSYNAFLLPNSIASGGVSGFATLLEASLNVEPAVTIGVTNVLLFLLGLLLLGGLQYGAKTIIGTLFLPFIVYFTRNWDIGIDDPLLGALFGGIGVGFGLGLVFRASASTGGTDLLAQIIHKYAGGTLGTSVFIMDGLIVAGSAFIFGLEFALYALISLFVTGRTIDVVQTGLGYAKVAFVITKHEETVRKSILKEVDRGVTKLEGRGGFTNDARPVLMCVVNRGEVTRLKRVIQLQDPEAFVVVSNASEVLGQGFENQGNSV